MYITFFLFFIKKDTLPLQFFFINLTFCELHAMKDAIIQVAPLKRIKL